MGDIRVLIADDEALVRRALAIFVNSAEGMSVVGEAADGQLAVAACSELSPDVVLMDIKMGAHGGVAAIAELADRLPLIRAIALTTFGSDETVIAALRAGAVGFLVKDTEPDQLVAAIRGVHEGGYVLSPDVARDLVKSIGKRSSPSEALVDTERLSEREHRVVELLAEGMSNAEIASTLFLSEATVKSHLRRIMTKWNVRDRVQVLVRAARAGLIDIS